MTSELLRLSEVFQDYARSVGWGLGDYRLFVNPNMDWGQIRIILAAREFPTGVGTPWFAVMHYLEKVLKNDPELLDSISLTVSTFAQIQAGGLHGLPEGYEELTGRIASGPAA